jgi:uncharacterized RmlC-like cupin family protein
MTTWFARRPWAITLASWLFVGAGTLLAAYGGIPATSWIVSRFDTTLTAWWWLLLVLPFSIVGSGILGFVASVWILQRIGNHMRVSETSRPSVVPAEGRRTASGLPAGSAGEEAFADPRAWVGYIALAPRATSQWHHHGTWDSYACVLRGVLRWEFGPGGADAIVVGRGDTGRMPSGVIHRDVSAGDEPLEMILFRAGEGTLTVDVDGPDADAAP